MSEKHKDLLTDLLKPVYMRTTLLFTALLATHVLYAQDEANNGMSRSHPEQPTDTLAEVAITATAATNRSMLQQPASLARLPQKELRRSTGLFLDDAINTGVPGVQMQRRTVSAGQQINIRGYGNGLGPRGANNNFDIQGTKVYLNGIPLTDAEGITVLDDIDFASVGEVEIIKGPAGALYGLAIAGVVSLNTVQPEAGRTSISQDVLMGSYGLQRYTTRLQVSGERGSLMASYGYQKADGYMAHTRSEKRFVHLAGTLQPNEQQRVSAYFGYSHSYDERGGELTIEQYNNRDYSGNPAYIKNNAHSEVISFRAGLSHSYAFSNTVSNTTTLFGTGLVSNASSAGGWTDKNPLNYGLRSTLDINLALNENFKLNGITGLEAQRQQAQIIGYTMVPDSTNLAGYNRIGNIKSNQYATTGTTSLFSEWTLSMPYDISLTAGLGLSSMHIHLQDRLFVPGSSKPSVYDARYDGMLSPHLALNKVFNQQASVYVAYSKGYRAPVSSNIVISTTGALNTGLKPESGNQFELGTKGSLLCSKLTYQLALFKTRFNNKMTAVAVPLNAHATAYTYVANGGGQDNSGLELSVAYTAYSADAGAFRVIRPFGNFSYSHFRYAGYSYELLDKNKETVIMDYSGKTVAGVPPVTANIGVDFSTAYGFYGNVVYVYRDAMPITSDGVLNTHDYGLLNAKLGWQQNLARHFSIDVFAGAENLTGTQYYYMVFINQLPDAYIPAPEKTNFFGGLRLKYEF